MQTGASKRALNKSWRVLPTHLSMPDSDIPRCIVYLITARAFSKYNHAPHPQPAHTQTNAHSHTNTCKAPPFDPWQHNARHPTCYHTLARAHCIHRYISTCMPFSPLSSSASFDEHCYPSQLKLGCDGAVWSSILTTVIRGEPVVSMFDVKYSLDPSPADPASACVPSPRAEIKLSVCFIIIIIIISFPPSLPAHM